MIYRAAPAHCLRIIELDSLWAVYHRPIGQTHLVTEPVVEILTALEDEPRDARAVATRIGAPDDVATVAAHLADLIATGLVRPQ